MKCALSLGWGLWNQACPGIAFMFSWNANCFSLNFLKVLVVVVMQRHQNNYFLIPGQQNCTNQATVFSTGSKNCQDEAFGGVLIYSFLRTHPVKCWGHHLWPAVQQQDCPPSLLTWALSCFRNASSDEPVLVVCRIRVELLSMPQDEARREHAVSLLPAPLKACPSANVPSSL